MMRSLWSGVGGLNAQQVAMDVIGNNIANVNTYGFKYSRTNFADMLSQTAKIATAPQGELGGKNAMQVGLGVSISSVEHIFSQGSSQNTDVATDMAIQGDGFFVVSPDGGNTQFYTRAGNFVFDADGNFVDSNGYVVQGWTRDPVTNRIDNTSPVANIQIDPGMTTPAVATTEVQLKANLTSGQTTNQMSAAYPLTSNSTTNASTYTSGFEDMGVLFNTNGQAFNLQNGQGVWVSFGNATLNSTTIGGVTATGTSVDVNITINSTNITGTLSGGSAASNASQLASLINQYTARTGVTASASSAGITLNNTNASAGDKTKNIELTIGSGDQTGLSGGSAVTAYKYLYNSGSANPTPNSASVGGTKNFKSIEDLRRYLQWQANDTTHGGAYGSEVTVNAKGQFSLSNTITNSTTGHVPSTLNIAVTSVANTTTTASVLFTQMMAGLAGSLPPSGTGLLTSQSMNAATHTASTEVFDSLGSKHTLSFHYRKQAQSTWSWTAEVPVPGSFTGTTSTDTNWFINPNARVMFNPDGSLANVTPQTLSLSWNNGSTGNQQIELEWGTPGLYDGITSFDSASTTNYIAQNGYTGGTLEGIRVDQTGTLVGSFSNGQSFGLAQVSMARFANNTGLMATGGNLFLASANSGDPTIGTPGTGGRGTIQSSALEMSNVDLSGQLTQMIVTQRAFQANSKTITTSDQMLQTVLQLKQ